MSTDLIPLALLMFAATYPSRALGLLTPGMQRLPRIALDYLQLVGPAVLAAIAAVNVLVVAPEGSPARFTLGMEAVAVLACLGVVWWRKNLFLGLVTAIVIIVVARTVASGAA